MSKSCEKCKARLGTGATARPGGGTTMTQQYVKMGSGAAHGEDAVGLYQLNVEPGMIIGRTVRTVALVDGFTTPRKIWIPAVSFEAVPPPGIDPWAYFPGGKNAVLHDGPITQKRRVLEFRNGGPTGLEVRLGKVILGFGSGGCAAKARARQMAGTGGRRLGEEAAASYYATGTGGAAAQTTALAVPAGVSRSQHLRRRYGGGYYGGGPVYG